MKTADFLLEIGCEELPPKSLLRLANALADGITAGLKQASLAFGDVDVFATPRRLAVLVHAVQSQQAEQNIDRRGPAVSAAYDDKGKPTPAAIGFARSCDTTVDQLQRLTTDKGEWLVFQKIQAGQLATALLPAIVEHSIQKLPIPKPMRWGNYKTHFIRPVHWIVLLYGEQTIEATLLGKQAGNTTYGHRFHAPGPLIVTTPNDYAEALKEQGYVIPDFNERKTFIQEHVQILAAEKKATAIMGEPLLNEVTALVEWPVPLRVDFDERFLHVPHEALIAAMQDHQKCFALTDKDKKLLPHFITVSNLQSTDPNVVIAGNERVMRARLADADFFYQTDLKHRLESRLEGLKAVTFQAKLGSLFDKTERVIELSDFIATKINADRKHTKRAASLAKCDLLSDMVGEFPALQGVMGAYYALHDGEDEAVATAIKEHYYPRFATDTVPTTLEGCAVALADRLDTLVGIFSINEVPSGDKDPYALRRAALGIVRIIITHQLNLSLRDLIEKALASYAAQKDRDAFIAQVQHFILDRLRAWYQEQHFSSDMIKAVLARQSEELFDFSRRLQAVNEFCQIPEAAALAAANKRVSKLLSKADTNNNSLILQSTLLTEPAECDLATQLDAKRKQVAPLFADRQYTEALTELAHLREPVDTFFDDVMVMVDDEKVRTNRLALLADLRHLFLEVADISLLQLKS